MNPFFSIVIPACNVERYVGGCLDRLLAQDFADWECLVCVEESRDGTEAAVRAYVDRDPRFRMFTGPRSGSPSTPRNKCLDGASGEYVVFVDADDAIAEGSLRRLHDKIAARPGADLYPCAIRVHDESTQRDFVHDNYPENAPAELTGREAICYLASLRRLPSPMAQMTICRRGFLEENALRFYPGLQQEDSQFLPRSLYRAKRVVPLHEPFYIYVKGREDAISSVATKDRSVLLGSFARVYKSLFEFFAQVSREDDFDRKVAASWAETWTGDVLLRWFDPLQAGGTPRTVRFRTLREMFSGGFADFNALLEFATPRKRLLAGLVRRAVKSPWLAPFVDFLLMRVYFPLVNGRRSA